MRLFVFRYEDPHFTQTSLPPSDLSEIKLLLPHLPQILLLAFCIYKLNKYVFDILIINFLK